MTWRPPAAAMSRASLMSVPRPAMLVATVIFPICPASATIDASWAVCVAFSTRCARLRAVSRRLTSSDASTLRVPIRIGAPVLWI